MFTVTLVPLTEVCEGHKILLGNKLFRKISVSFPEFDLDVSVYYLKTSTDW